MISTFFWFQAGGAIYPVAVSSSLSNPEAPSDVAVEGDLEAASPAEAVLVAFCLYFIFDYTYHHQFRRRFITLEYLIDLKHSNVESRATNCFRT